MRNLFRYVHVVANGQRLLLGRIIGLAYTQQVGSLEDDRGAVSWVTVWLGTRPIGALDENGIRLCRCLRIPTQHGHLNAGEHRTPLYVRVPFNLAIDAFGSR